MRFPPPSVQLSWPLANYIDPVSRGPTILIVESTILAIAWICLALRLYVRFGILRRSWWDDWIMLVAATFATGLTACVCLATQKYGWNVHVWDVLFDNLVIGRKISIAGQTLFVFASGLTKVSILLSYLRIAAPGTKFRQLSIASIGLVVACIVIFLTVLWTQCSPPSEYWNLIGGEKHCEEEGPPLMGQISTTILTDLLVYVLPMPMLYRLSLPLCQRIGLMVVFGLGGIVVLAGCMRLYWTHYTVYETYDVTWYGSYLWIWTAVEVNLGIICGCVPSLKPLLFRFRSHFSSQHDRSQDADISEKGLHSEDYDFIADTILVTQTTNDFTDTFEGTSSGNGEKLALNFDDEKCDCAFHTSTPLPHAGDSWLEADQDEKDFGRDFQGKYEREHAADNTKRQDRQRTGLQRTRPRHADVYSAAEVSRASFGLTG